MSSSPSARRRYPRPSPARRRALAVLLTLLTALPFPAAVFAQESSATGAAGKNQWAVSTETADSVFFIYQDENGETTCRVVSRDEAATLGGETGVQLHQINHLDEPGADASGSDASSSASGAVGLTIILRATAQLEQNPAAKAAFIAAAAKWESLIQDTITVVIDVDYGSTFFGTAFPSPNILGVTDSQGLFFNGNYTDVRERLSSRASNAEELALYNSLPQGSLPTDIGSTSTVIVQSPALRALGAISPVADPATETNFGPPPRIGFNSAFGFDFNPADGITGDRTDFDAVAVHEIGHALGFDSNVGVRELRPSDPIRAALWDLFRFRPSVGPSAFSSAQRVLSSGGEQVYYDGAAELGLSTGRPDNTGGDGQQASHWKDNTQGRPFIGLMDPTLPRNTRDELSPNDLRAIDFLGFRLGPPLPPPANDNFVNAVVLNGPNGTVAGTNAGATNETGEPNPANDSGTVSVWYRWTAPASGTATIDTVGSNYDTTLGVYTGAAVSAQALVGHNDDIRDGVERQSRVTFTAVAGTTYNIQVNGWRGSTGSIQLNWTAASAFRLSGRITDNLGNGIEGATVTLTTNTGASAGSALTDALGNYAFNGLAAGSYTLTPSKPGFTGSPQTVTVNSDTTVNLSLFLTPITVSGTIRDAQNNVIPGVGYNVTGASGTNTQTANDSGFYSAIITPTASSPVTITPVKYGYTFSPASATFNGTSGGSQTVNFTGTLNNPIDASAAFVTQHYRDFLGREPDQAGLDFWRSGIDQCGPNVSCTEVKRIDTSAAFFLSIESQETGVLVYRMWKTAYANIDGTPVPVRRQQFLEDTALVGQNVQVGVGPWQQTLEANKAAYANIFANRAVFKGKYDVMTNAQYVDALNVNAEGALSQAERDALVNGLDGGTETRATVLRKVAEDETLRQSQLRKAFVLMQYFGYLRRDPDASDFQGNLDPQFLGYQFWLGKLNQFNGSYIDAEMVKAFITSIEYRQRFGQ